MIRINNRQMRWWLAWMLPAFFLRSLVPVGFMPMVSAGDRIQLALCDSYAPVPTLSGDMPMHPGMDMAQHTPHLHQDHGGCLFGSGPALGAPLVFAISPVVSQRPLPLAASAAQVGSFAAIRRSQSARGPPA